MNKKFDETNRGVLFTNDKKEHEKQPDFTGNININGKKYRLAGWKRESTTGKEYTTLSISEFNKNTGAGGYTRAETIQEPKGDGSDRWGEVEKALGSFGDTPDFSGKDDKDDIPF